MNIPPDLCGSMIDVELNDDHCHYWVQPNWFVVVVVLRVLGVQVPDVHGHDSSALRTSSCPVSSFTLKSKCSLRLRGHISMMVQTLLVLVHGLVACLFISADNVLAVHDVLVQLREVPRVLGIVIFFMRARFVSALSGSYLSASNRHASHPQWCLRSSCRFPCLYPRRPSCPMQRISNTSGYFVMKLFKCLAQS